jgi:hypothetical protein
MRAQPAIAPRETGNVRPRPIRGRPSPGRWALPRRPRSAFHRAVAPQAFDCAISIGSARAFAKADMPESLCDTAHVTSYPIHL